MRVLLAALAFFVVVTAVCAQTLLGFPPGTFSVKSYPSPITYVGPGDIVSGATEWYGLRAYSSAYAAGLGNAVRVVRASDSAQQDITVLANGSLDIASANTFAGVDATCTGTIALTTLTCAGASSTPHALSTLTGAGITQPSYIVSCGAFAGGAGTCTLNAAQTVSVGETISMQYGLGLSILYNQSGSGNPDAQNGPTAPSLLPSCLNGLPCIDFNGCCYFVAGQVNVDVPQPYTWSSVATRSSAFTTIGIFIRNDNNGNVPTVAWNNVANQMLMYAGTAQINVSGISDGAWHSLHAIFNDPSGSTLNVDGTDNSTNGIGTSGWLRNVNQQYIGVTAQGGPLYMNGRATEVGLWPSSFSAGNRTAVCHNQYAYWGTSVSC